MELLIDGDGNSCRLGVDAVTEAVSKRGFIHIRPLGRSVMVSLHPQLVRPVTMAGACYEIADLNPESTFVYADGQGGRSEVYPGFKPALRRIYGLMAAAGSVKLYPPDAATEYSPP